MNTKSELSDNSSLLMLPFDDSYEIFEDFRNDNTFKHFLECDFDAKSTPLLHGVTINEQITKITNGMEILNKELRTLVSDKYEDLLAQATKVDTLENVLNVIHTRIETLLLTLEKLRAKLIEPFNRIAHQMVLLNRLQITCDLLRRIIRIIHLGKRLKQTQIDEKEPSLLMRELTKAAQYISEIELLFSEDISLKKIEVIQNDYVSVKQIKSHVIREANDLLTIGLQKQDNTQIGTALQVYYSLKMLNNKLQQIIQEKSEFLSKTIKDSLDVNMLNQNKSLTGPGRVMIPMTVGQSASLRSELWNSVDSLLEQIYVTFSQISAVYKILRKRRDPLTHVCFIDDIENTNGVNDFWIHITKLLSEQMCKSANDSNVLKEILEGKYPKLLSSFSELWKRISRDDRDINAEKILRSSMQPFESAYLSRSLSLLFDSVNRVFADAKETALTSSMSGNYSISAAPSEDDIDVIVKTISSELSLASVDPQLSKSVAKNVRKTINSFLIKCEQLTSVDGDSTQVIGSLTASQILNATILHRLNLFQSQMNDLFVSSAFVTDTMKTADESLITISTLMKNIVNPMINSVTDAIEAIILTMHGEDYTSSNTATDAQCSLYMRELQGFIARVSNDYFSILPECDVIKNCIYKVANRMIDLFLRHTTLIRPISNYGKLKIAADFAQLEMAIVPLCQKIGDLGKSYRALRSFKPLLFQDAETIAASPIIGDLIPYSLAIQFLISSFGPNELKSPHESMCWSLTRYTKWLDNHENESERLMLINKSLESYVMQIRHQQGKSFAPVYPILFEMLQKALKSVDISQFNDQ